VANLGLEQALAVQEVDIEGDPIRKPVNDPSISEVEGPASVSIYGALKRVSPGRDDSLDI
jgi:hypothetical protein